MPRMLTVLAGAILAATASRPAPAGEPALEVGRPFPEVVLPTLDGEPTSITEYRGRKASLYVFGSW